MTLPLAGTLTEKDIPLPFSYVNGIAKGLSDHLPVVGRIFIPAS